MAVVGILGQTGGAAGLVPGADVIVSHSAGAAGMTDHGVVTMTDGDYRLLEVKQSGTLTFDDDQLARGVRADLCLVNGGYSGQSQLPNLGGPGGKMLNIYGMLLDDLIVAIGAGGAFALGGTYPVAGGQTSVRRSSDANGVEVPTGRGTGGGGGGDSSDIGDAATTMGYVTVGDGVAKRPFGDASYFNPHCGGGGGGGCYDAVSSYRYSGGAGGTNGGNGALRGAPGSGYAGGAAGDSSAGAGAPANSGSTQTPGANGAYYGGGGGGGGSNVTNGTYGWGGNGYKGVIWIRIPA